MSDPAIVLEKLCKRFATHVAVSLARSRQSGTAFASGAWLDRDAGVYLAAVPQGPGRSAVAASSGGRQAARGGLSVTVVMLGIVALGAVSVLAWQSG